MSYNILLSDRFKRDFKKLTGKFVSIKADLEDLITSLEKTPFQGIPLGNNCYKLRLAIRSKGRGKSGGARVITFVKVISERLYLITIYDKSEKEDISSKELLAILKETGLL